MKACPVCKSSLSKYEGACPHCALDLRLAEWRNEGIMAIGLALVLVLIGSYLSSYVVWSSTYNRLFYQTTATYPYAGLGGMMLLIGAIVLIAGIASAAYYDLRIWQYSKKIRVANSPLPLIPPEQGR